MKDKNHTIISIDEGKACETTSRVSGCPVNGNSWNCDPVPKESLFLCTTERQGVSSGSNCKEGNSNHFVTYFKTNSFQEEM